MGRACPHLVSVPFHHRLVLRTRPPEGGIVLLVGMLFLVNSLGFWQLRQLPRYVLAPCGDTPPEASFSVRRDEYHSQQRGAVEPESPGEERRITGPFAPAEVGCNVLGG